MFRQLMPIKKNIIINNLKTEALQIFVQATRDDGTKLSKHVAGSSEYSSDELR